MHYVTHLTPRLLSESQRSTPSHLDLFGVRTHLLAMCSAPDTEAVSEMTWYEPHELHASPRHVSCSDSMTTRTKRRGDRRRTSVGELP